MMTGNQVRQMFIDFFVSKGHTHVASSPLVPHGDPTLLFTNAGMNQFKDTFLGLEKRPYRRAVTAQKCVRAGGKHNDLDAVGRTARHHTFFEMLGNFSFGDYFKKEALEYAWELCTSKRWLGLPADRLWATIYKDDDEAHEIWTKVIGLPPERVVRLGEKDNFWAMGDTGPCGPCSEIFIDLGEEQRCDADVCSIETCGCDRWREFWNNVFMQFNRDASGKLVPLEKPGVDTGMGLERITSVVQGVWSNYDTDLLRDIIRTVEEMSGRAYDPGAGGLAFRVIADHVRACAFLIADGVRFSNEGRGYVMRRILRRAVRYGRTLGFTGPFMHRVVGAVVALMGDAYPEVRQQQALIEAEIRRDEERFFATLEQGMRRLEEILEGMRKEGRRQIGGEEAFQLYDTYGFPLDIAEDVAWEQGLTVDRNGFQKAMEVQRQRARAARKAEYMGEAVAALSGRLKDVPAGEFTGYAAEEGEATVLAVFSEAGEPTGAGAGDRAVVVLDRTPFYAEAGGQVGDTGWLTAPGLSVRVEDTQKLPSGHYLHYGAVESGFLENGQRVLARVDGERRRHIRKNHTATHLLHKALREVLGSHAQQAGSLVAPDRLRFDFTHDQPLSREQVKRIEAMVNEQIQRGTPVTVQNTSLTKAREMGAMALFGEKYGDVVRVVQVGDFSLELCGGTHVGNVAEIGVFTVAGQGGIGAGVRRIEAYTGQGAVEHLFAEVERLQAEVAARLEEKKALEKQVEELQKRLARSEAEDVIKKVKAIRPVQAADRFVAPEQPAVYGEVQADEVKVVSERVSVGTMDDLRAMTDLVRDKLGGGTVVALGALQDGKVNLVVAVTKDLVARGVHAGQIIREVAKVVEGGGGGRPDMAQAGGRNPAKLQEALDLVPSLVKGQLKA